MTSQGKYVLYPEPDFVRRPPSHRLPLAQIFYFFISSARHEFEATPWGKGVVVRGPSSLDALSRRHGRSLRSIRVIEAMSDTHVDCAIFQRFPGLRSLFFSLGVEVSNVQSLSKLPELARLSIQGGVREPLDLSAFRMLQEFDFVDGAMVTGLDRTSLVSCFVVRLRESTIRALPATIRTLYIVESRCFEDVSAFASLPALRVFNIAYVPSVKSLRGISSLTSLTHLVLERCSKLTDIDEALLLPNLEVLEVRDCKTLRSVSSFPDHSPVTHAYFVGKTRLETPVENVVRNLKHLKHFM